MTTVTIELATNKIPDSLQEFLFNCPAVISYGFTIDASKAAKEKLAQYTKRLREDIEDLEDEVAYHESEAAGCRYNLKIAQHKYKAFKEMYLAQTQK